MVLDGLINGRDSASIVLTISIMLFGSFLLTRLTKLGKLPNVTAYILLGIIIGPFCLHLFNDEVISHMSFVKDVALTFVAFSIGQFFNFEKLKQNGKHIILLSLMISLLRAIAMFLAMKFLVGFSVAKALVIAAISLSASPTSTLVTIRQMKADGNFVVCLLETIAVLNVIAIFAFGITESIAVGIMDNSSLTVAEIILPIVYNLIACLVGFGLGFALKYLMPTRRTKDNRLIILISVLLAFCGGCLKFGISPVLGCMAMGGVYKNVTNDDKLFKQINYFSPPILVIFFVVSGMNLQLDQLFVKGDTLLLPLALVGFINFLVRDIFTYAGSYVSCKILKMDKTTTKYLGLALFPQSTVAIGLAAIASELFHDQVISTVVIASCILNEIVGPILTKLAISLAMKDEVNLENKEQFDPTYSDHNSSIEENEQAFIEAHDELKGISE